MGTLTELQFNGPYKEMYAVLFSAITDALNMMEDKDFDAAVRRLKAGQIDAEEIFVDWDD